MKSETVSLLSTGSKRWVSRFVSTYTQLISADSVSAIVHKFRYDQEEERQSAERYEEVVVDVERCVFRVFDFFLVFKNKKGF